MFRPPKADPQQTLLQQQQIEQQQTAIADQRRILDARAAETAATEARAAAARVARSGRPGGVSLLMNDEVGVAPQAPATQRTLGG
jgi:hypothetical protein